ncbi:DUF6538 domain-containing protein [Falsiroseomonas sp. HW251]|uniref:DUF6538 domain-containing protein n=1 Tax=Falsiroseomonas sp. HW251 TaxID=3390998 RepID=UPI003D31720B
MFYFYAQVPNRLKAVAGRTHVKRSLGTRCPREARAKWPAELARWDTQIGAWEREMKRESVTAERALGLAAAWAASIDHGAPLHTGGEDSDVFEPLVIPECHTPERLARMWGRVEVHAIEALELAGITATADTFPLLLNAMVPVVNATYLREDLTALAAAHPLNPLAAVRQQLPAVPPPPACVAVHSTDGPSFDAIWSAWKAVTATNARTVDETRSMLRMLADFLGHDDAGRVTRDDLRSWRDHLKTAHGLTNNTWNNRLSLVGQVFKRAVADERLPMDPTDGLRLPKSKPHSPLPYSDDDAAAILLRARSETLPTLRWAHWVMAFTGMRVGEVLQLGRDDLREDPDSGIWTLAIHEHTKGNSVKTGMPRNVPVHPALVAEGFVAYALTVEAGAPLFPDKEVDKYGRRGGRGWNAVSSWVRRSVGITDARKAPNHSWRHRMEDELRAAEVSEDVRDAILGHARKRLGGITAYGARHCPAFTVSCLGSDHRSRHAR